MKVIYSIMISLLMVNTSQSQDRPTLSTQIESLIKEQDQISEQRKAELVELAGLISEQIKNKEKADVTFVCTHNSRRSQLSEIWFRTASEYYELQKTSAYSGGTEATAFNHRMVAAVERFGFDITTLEESDNTVYQVATINGAPHKAKMFSKKYANAYNPQSDFVAVMVCDQADKACPVVFGADARFSLPYIDPKRSDNTPEEGATYDAKVREIGREIIFMTSYIKE